MMMSAHAASPLQLRIEVSASYSPYLSVVGILQAFIPFAFLFCSFQILRLNKAMALHTLLGCPSRPLTRRASLACVHNRPLSLQLRSIFSAWRSLLHGPNDVIQRNYAPNFVHSTSGEMILAAPRPPVAVNLRGVGRRWRRKALSTNDSRQETASCPQAPLDPTRATICTRIPRDMRRRAERIQTSYVF